MSLAAVMGKQLDLYKDFPDEKVFVENYSQLNFYTKGLLGILIAMSWNSSIKNSIEVVRCRPPNVNVQVSPILFQDVAFFYVTSFTTRSTQHNVPTERQGCARGVGACAATHTDLVLVELENVSKWEHAKRSSGFFGFIKVGAFLYPISKFVSIPTSFFFRMPCQFVSTQTRRWFCSVQLLCSATDMLCKRVHLTL